MLDMQSLAILFGKKYLYLYKFHLLWMYFLFWYLSNFEETIDDTGGVAFFV